jgi:hypothetical protein
MNEEERKAFDIKVEAASGDKWKLNRLLCDLEQFPKTFEEELAIVRTKIAVLEASEQIIRKKQQEEYLRKEEARKIALAKAEAAWLEDPDNQATLRGWQALKAITPNLDGVDTFQELPPSLKYRYDAFRRAVENKPQLPEVKSSKQLYGTGEYTRIRSDYDYYDQESFE